LTRGNDAPAADVQAALRRLAVSQPIDDLLPPPRRDHAREPGSTHRIALARQPIMAEDQESRLFAPWGAKLSVVIEVAASQSAAIRTIRGVQTGVWRKRLRD